MVSQKKAKACAQSQAFFIYDSGCSISCVREEMAAAIFFIILTNSICSMVKFLFLLVIK